MDSSKSDQLKSQIDDLKYILENIGHPEDLSDHPWTKSLVVRKAILDDPDLGLKTTGYQLVVAVAQVFRQMMPSTPPKRGKRLDTRWCQFGILAAQYFAPFLFGTVYPTTLHDAWGRIDQSISLFVFNRPLEEISETEISAYQITKNESEPAAYSTLSDWNNAGLRKLAEHFQHYEKFLTQHPSQLSEYPDFENTSGEKSQKKPDGSIITTDISEQRKKITFPRKTIQWAVIVLVAITFIYLGVKAWRINLLINSAQSEVTEITNLLIKPLDNAGMNKIGPIVPSLHEDLINIKSELASVLWLGGYLGWVPTYGYELSKANDLIDYAIYLSDALNEMYQGLTPFSSDEKTETSSLNLSQITALLNEEHPHFIKGNDDIQKAMGLLFSIDDQKISPSLQGIFIKALNPYLKTFQNELVFLMELPKLLGASEDGPQTYMVLAQNEDELRPSGGFITAVGSVVLKDGEVISYQFENSVDLDDWTKPYPLAPWQLDNYMNSQVLVLRDSNWFSDFPTAAGMAEYLYAYTRFHGVDGVFALDQHFVQSILSVLGPVELDNVNYPITAENLTGFLRSEKYRVVAGQIQPDWSHYKELINKLFLTIVAKLKSGSNLPWEQLAETLRKELDERHLLIILHDPAASNAVADLGWDGAIRHGLGDYMMVVDSNIGFNKVNALMDTTYDYSIDLSNLLSPSSKLTITHKNNATGDVPCIQWLPSEGSYDDLMNRCYWDYLRVYTSSDAKLVNATPHAIPAEWMIKQENVPARVDTLTERIEGVQGYGTLLVVPVGQSLETSFTFDLPASIFDYTENNDQITFHLKFQKQPGTFAIPLNLTIHLPVGAEVTHATAGYQKGNDWYFMTNLKQDVEIGVSFTSPPV